MNRTLASAAALTDGVFLLYALGACRTIYVGDSGELVTAVSLLGIPHPPGYPLYVLLGKLWTLAVPVGSIAFRMSLFSAACAAAAVGGLYMLARHSGFHPVAAATSALLLAFSPSFWGEANIQRVYSLNALFVVLVAIAAFSWYRSRKGRTLILCFFLCGLGASNHMFMAIAAVPLAMFVVTTEASLLQARRTVLLCAAAFVGGLVPYLYLPLRSRADPALDWGNPESWSNFLAVTTRRDFWQRAWIEGPQDLWPILIDYVRGIGDEFVWVGAILALMGMLLAWRRRWPALFPLLIMVGNFVAVALHGSRADIFIWHRYYIPSYVMTALLAGLTIHTLLERIPRRLHLLPLAVPFIALALNYREFDRSRYRIAEDFSRTLLQAVPPGGHLAASDDNILFVLTYLHLVERVRPDVDLILQGVGGADLPSLQFNPDTDPLFLTHHPNWRVAGLDVVPMGLVFQTVRAGRPLPAAVIPKRELDGERDPRVPKDFLTKNLIGQFHFMLGATFENREWVSAFREFAAARNAAPDNDVLLYNLGLVYHRNGLFDEALEAFGRAYEINPRIIPGPSSARASDRIAEVGAELARVRRLERSIAVERIGEVREVISPADHLQLASWLEDRGERLAAHGHRLRALIKERRDEAGSLARPRLEGR